MKSASSTEEVALLSFRALPEFKACAPWIQDLAEAAFVRGIAEGKRQCGPKTPEVPLCDGCAQAWFCERNHLQGDDHCVVCAFLGNKRTDATGDRQS